MSKEESPSQSLNFGNHRKLPASDIGLKAPRSCTNPCGLILFIFFWVGMGAVAVISYKNGNLARLYRGADYMGNLCGGTNADYDSYNFTSPPGFLFPIEQNSNAFPWAGRKYLWYPVTFVNGQFSLTQARTQGVCVAACPTSGQFLGVYKQPMDTTVTMPYYVLFNSSVSFNRCIPDLSTFMCDTNTVCKAVQARTNTTLDDVYDGLMNGFNDVRSNWWVLLVCVFIAIAVCFLWMLVMRRLVKPMVVVTILVVVTALGVGGFLLFREHSNLQSSDPDSAKYYLGGAITMWVIDFLILCVLLFTGKDIMVACDIIEEATKIPTSIPTTLFVPLVTSLVILPFGIFFLFTSATIYTCQDTLQVNMTVPQIISSQNISFVPTNATQITLPHWRVAAEVFNIFMFLWTVGFVHAICFMVIAFCAVFWYWSKPGDDKCPEEGVCTAFSLTMRNHLGSLAIGSLIIAIITLLRMFLAVLEKRLEKYSKNSDAVKCCLYCAECMLACFHRVVKFINKNAYIVQAMTGEGFLDSAKHALSLLLHNAIAVGAVSVIGEWVCMFGKIFITALVGIIAYFILRSGENNFVLTLIIVLLVTYFITCVFINVFHVCIDTVLMSYCYDLMEHDGQSKPYYFPSDLAKHVEKARERMKKAQEANAVPLKEQV
jgi:hypothetical protein